MIKARGGRKGGDDRDGVAGTSRSRFLFRLELVQQNRVAFTVQDHRHPADGAVNNVALEGDVLGFQIGDQFVQVSRPANAST